MLNKSKTQFLPVALEAILEEPIAQGSCGLIKCQGVYYKAEFYAMNVQRYLQAGQRVFMIARRENVALIIPS